MTTASRATAAASSAVVLAGVGLLAWRLRLHALEDPARSAALALILGAVLLASLLTPAPDRSTRLAVVLAVVAAGLVAIGPGAAVAGPRPPTPWAATALPLALLAAVAEEALFRRVLYALVLHHGPTVAVVVSALAFALLHVPAYGWVAFPVDLGAGLLFGWQRHAAGTWTAPAITHAAANLAAMLR